MVKTKSCKECKGQFNPKHKFATMCGDCYKITKFNYHYCDEDECSILVKCDYKKCWGHSKNDFRKCSNSSCKKYIHISKAYKQCFNCHMNKNGVKEEVCDDSDDCEDETQT